MHGGFSHPMLGGKQLNSQSINSTVTLSNKIEIGFFKIFRFHVMENITILNLCYQIKKIIMLQLTKKCYLANQHNKELTSDHIRLLDLAKTDDNDENKMNAVKLY